MVADPILPNGTEKGTVVTGYPGTVWPYVSDKLFRDRALWVDVLNAGVGGMSMVDDWCGRDGLDVPAVYTDGVNFDPNSYLSDALTEALSGTYDERWVHLAWAGKDAATDVTAADYEIALGNIFDYFDNSSVNVIIGLSPFNQNSGQGKEALYNGYSSAITAVQAAKGAGAGADLYTLLGTEYALNSVLSPTQAVYDQMQVMVYDAIAEVFDPTGVDVTNRVYQWL